MVSYAMVVDYAASVVDEPEEKRAPVRGRRIWVRGDVRCLICARLVGRLLGSRDTGPGASTTQNGITFFAYKSAASSAVVAYKPGMRLGCPACGGAGMIDEMEFLTMDEEPATSSDEPKVPRRRGRPRKQFKAPAPANGWEFSTCPGS